MLNKKSTGIIACIILALISTKLGELQQFIGAPMIGLFMGMLCMNLTNPGKQFLEGSKFCSKKLLTLAIVLAGGTLDFRKIVGIGSRALPMLLINICVCFTVAYCMGRVMKLSWNTSMLVGSGTAICGGTAIATTASIIKAKESEIGYAMTAIFLFDIFGALLFPYLATWCHMTPNQFGFLAGSAINDTSSVVAAEATYNILHHVDLNLAMTVKLARTTLLVLIAIVFAGITAKAETKDHSSTGHICRTVIRVFPWFVLLFILMAVMNTFGLFTGLEQLLGVAPNTVVPALKVTYKFLTTAALCGVGFKMHIKDLIHKGLKPILLGGITWLAVSTSSLTFIYLLRAYVK